MCSDNEMNTVLVHNGDHYGHNHCKQFDNFTFVNVVFSVECTSKWRNKSSILLVCFSTCIFFIQFPYRIVTLSSVANH